MAKRKSKEPSSPSIDELLEESESEDEINEDDDATNFTVHDTSEDDKKWETYYHYFGMTMDELKEILKKQGKTTSTQSKHNLILLIMGESDTEANWSQYSKGSFIVHKFDNYIEDADKKGGKFRKKESIFYGKNYDPIDIFRLLFDDIINVAVVETQNHIKQAGLESQVIELFKKPIDKNIIEIYIACGIIMGASHTSSVDNAFKKGFQFSLAVSSLISTKQYYFLSNNIRFFNNYITHESKLNKVEILEEIINSNFKKYYYPSEFITVDEGIIPTKNHALNLSQYQKDKPDKWGYKLYKVVDSEGYLFGFFLYKGKDSKCLSGGFSKVGSCVVYELISRCNLAGHYHTLVTDNYFTSIELFKAMSDMKIYSIGTCRPKIGVTPQVLLDAKLNKKYQYKYMYRTDCRLLMMAIFDSKKFYFMDSKYIQETQELYQSNKEKKKGKAASELPAGLVEYKHHMGAVDLHERRVKDGAFYGHHKKWYMAYIWFLVESSIINAQILFKKHNIKSTTIYNFKQQIIEGLISKTTLRLKKLSLNNFIYSNLNPIKNQIHYNKNKKNKTKIN